METDMGIHTRGRAFIRHKTVDEGWIDGIVVK